jgi:hypothetical protein
MNKIFFFLQKQKKHLGKIIIISSAILILFIATNLYKNFQEKKYSEIFHQALIDQQVGESQKAKEGLKKIHQSSSAPSDIKSLASMRYAAFMLAEDNKEEAIKIYQSINSCFNCDDYLKDLAGLLLIKIWIADSASFDEKMLVKIEKIENSAKTLRYQISEQKAIYLMLNDKLEESFKVFDAIAKSPEINQEIKSRVEDSIKILISKGLNIEEKAEKKDVKEDQKNNSK